MNFKRLPCCKRGRVFWRSLKGKRVCSFKELRYELSCICYKLIINLMKGAMKVRPEIVNYQIIAG